MSNKSEKYHVGEDDEIPGNDYGSTDIKILPIEEGIVSLRDGQVSPEELCDLCEFNEPGSSCKLCDTSKEDGTPIAQGFFRLAKKLPDYDAQAGGIPEEVLAEMKREGWA